MPDNSIKFNKYARRDPHEIVRQIRLSPQAELHKIEEERLRVEKEAFFIDMQMKRDIATSFKHLGHVQNIATSVRMSKGITSEPVRESYQALPRHMVT